jgi:hypothetical protein
MEASLKIGGKMARWIAPPAELILLPVASCAQNQQGNRARTSFGLGHGNQYLAWGEKSVKK